MFHFTGNILFANGKIKEQFEKMLPAPDTIEKFEDLKRKNSTQSYARKLMF